MYTERREEYQEIFKLHVDGILSSDINILFECIKKRTAQTIYIEKIIQKL